MTERSIAFGANNGLIGTICEPSALSSNDGGLGWILFNAGVVHRVGPHRINVRLARMLANQGIASIRFDLAGLGDSSRADGQLPFEAQAVSDLSSAMDIRADGSGPQVQGFFDYRLQGISHANNPQLNNRQNALNSLLTFEVLEDWLFVEARGVISQQNRSAFAAVAADAAGTAANRVETSVFQLAPYLRGRISDVATYQLRLSGTQSHSSGVTSSKTITREWLANVRSATPSAKIGWAVDANALTVENSAEGKSQAARARGALIYNYEPQLNFSVYQGIEATAFANAARRNGATPGIGMAWTPSNRTQVAAIRDKRFFGPGQTIRLSHRLSSIALTYNDEKEVAAAANLIAASGQGSLSGLMSDLLAASIPDPIARAQAVNSRLPSGGQPAAAGAGFDTNRALLRRNRQGSAAMIGANNTLTLSFGTLDQQALGGAVAGVADTFAVSPQIRQQTLRAAWSQRMSALSTLTVSGTRLKTEAPTGVAATISMQKTLTISLSRQLSARTNASIGSRHGRFDSTVADSHRENAILATLAVRF